MYLWHGIIIPIIFWISIHSYEKAWSKNINIVGTVISSF